MEISKKNENDGVKNSFKQLLLITPAASLFLASLYYYILLRGDGALSPKILTISDHFDKAIEFIIPVFIVNLAAFGGGFFNGALRAERETVEKEELSKFQKLFSSINKALIVLVLATIALDLLPFEITLVLTLTLLVIFFPLIISHLYFKLTAKKLQELENRKYLIATAMILVTGVAMHAYKDLLAIRDLSKSSNQIEKIIFYDKLTHGYLVGRNGTIECHNGENSQLISNTLAPFPSKSATCHLKIRKKCRTNKETTKDSSPPK